jgi:hypothetical protein
MRARWESPFCPLEPGQKSGVFSQELVYIVNCCEKVLDWYAGNRGELDRAYVADGGDQIGDIKEVRGQYPETYVSSE